MDGAMHLHVLWWIQTASIKEHVSPQTEALDGMELLPCPCLCLCLPGFPHCNTMVSCDAKHIQHSEILEARLVQICDGDNRDFISALDMRDPKVSTRSARFPSIFFRMFCEQHAKNYANKAFVTVCIMPSSLMVVFRTIPGSMLRRRCPVRMSHIYILAKCLHALHMCTCTQVWKVSVQGMALAKLLLKVCSRLWYVVN